jgi:hypothetical protein
MMLPLSSVLSIAPLIMVCEFLWKSSNVLPEVIPLILDDIALHPLPT